ncbi:tetratricopeptide repeat protein [Thermovibrio sp.]
MRRKARRFHWKQLANVEIFTNVEIVAFVGLFVLLSFILFPKGQIKEILTTEKDYNIDLSRIYLKELLNIKFDPKLFSLLVEKDIKLGRYGEAHRLIESYLNKVKDRKLKEFLLKQDFKILLSEYYSKKDKKEKERLKKEIKKFLATYEREIPSLKTYQFVYKEALAFGFKNLALENCKKLAETTGSIRYYRELLVLATATGNKKVIKEAFKALSKRQKTPAEIKKELLKTAIYLKEKGTAEKIAKELLSQDLLSYKDLENLINFELYYRDYDSALKFCKAYYKKSSSFKVLKKCIEIAMWKGDYREVSRLIKENLKRFRNDEDKLKFFLSAARAANNRELSLKIANILFKRITEGR